MHGRQEGKRRGAPLLAAVAMVFATAWDASSAETSRGAAPLARLRDSRDRSALAQAIEGAGRRLGQARCRHLLTTFVDAAGRPLNEALDAQGLAPSDYLSRIFFYDGSASGCAQRRLAYTEPGSRAVFVCGPRFWTVWRENPAYAECAVIHEALHSLGLGENPPSWEEITARVLDACR